MKLYHFSKVVSFFLAMTCLFMSGIGRSQAEMNVDSYHIGDKIEGGVVACLSPDNPYNNFIVATEDSSDAVIWGRRDRISVWPPDWAKDGKVNTQIITDAMGTDLLYAARLCDMHEIDSMGNTPCKSGNICYDDWFLPAQDQLKCLYQNKDMIGIVAGWGSGHWSSTYHCCNPKNIAGFQSLYNGYIGLAIVDYHKLKVRCIRNLNLK